MSKKQTKQIPDEAVLGTPVADPEAGEKAAESLKVLQAEDRSSVEVFVVEAKALGKNDDDHLIFVEGPVTHDTLTASKARGLFTKEDDNTAIYHQHGAPGGLPVVNIVTLVKLRGKHAKSVATEQSEEAKAAQKESVSKAGKATTRPAATRKR